MKIRTQKHYDQLKDVIGQIGTFETLEALAEIAQGHVDVCSEKGIAIGSSEIAASSLSELAARFAYERNFEIHERGKQP